MGPLTIIYLLHNFLNSNSWIIRFFSGGPFSFELDNFDCTKFYYQLDIVWAVYHLVTYTQSNKIHNMVFLQLCNGWTCRVVRVLPHTKVCEYSLYKTLLMMDR